MSAPPRTPEVNVQLLLRAPAADVYEAFVEPALLCRFWLVRSSGRLEVGARVTWSFIVEGAEAEIHVEALEPGKRIEITWDGGERVTWTFEARGLSTLVTIAHTSIGGSPDEAIAKALDSTQGFTLVLCSLKGLLEHGIDLNLMRDKFPDAKLAR